MTKTCLRAVLGGVEVGDGFPVRVMGVLNVSQESFYKGSVVTPEAIQDRARAMIASGASMLDVGGRSTWPLAPPISTGEERDRVERALDALLPIIENANVPVSIDTQFASVARAAMTCFERHHVEHRFVLNDVSGLHADPDLAGWLADTGVPAILMASHGKPGDSLGIEETVMDLERSVERLERAGYNTAGRVVIDPAVGRWIPEKTPARDAEILRNLPRFRTTGHPILVAVSRKSFIGGILDRADPADRLAGTLAATSIAVYNGAHAIRTHDVNRDTLDTIALASAIKTLEP